MTEKTKWIFKKSYKQRGSFWDREMGVTTPPKAVYGEFNLGYFRHINTYNERRNANGCIKDAYQLGYKIKVRAKRNNKNIPCEREDIPVSIRRTKSWKNKTKRKRQWK